MCSQRANSDNQDVEDIGTYEVWLSSHIGVDTNLEDPNDPVASACDDGLVRLPLLPPPIIRLPRICPLSRERGGLLSGYPAELGHFRDRHRT